MTEWWDEVTGWWDVVTEWWGDLIGFYNSNPWIGGVFLLLAGAYVSVVGIHAYKKGGLHWPLYGTYFTVAYMTLVIIASISETYDLSFPDNYIVGTVILSNLITFNRAVTLSMYIAVSFKVKSLLNKTNE